MKDTKRESPAVATGVTPVLSAAVVVLRETERGIEVLLLQRNNKIKVHGGSWVFPGGKAELADCPQWEQQTSLSDLDEAAMQQVARSAACRETWEEAGIQLRPDDLNYCSRWITPEVMPKRFDAWFFLTRVTQPTVTIDQNEIQAAQWLTPSEALRAHEEAGLSLPPPTFLTLLQLSECASVEDALTTLSQKPSTYQPRLCPTKTGFHSIYEEDHHYASPTTDMTKPCHRLILAHGKYTYMRDM